MHYAKSGEGSISIILNHGWGMSWRVWQRLLEIVDPLKYTVYAMDITGFGDSDKPIIQYSIDNLTNSLIEFVHSLGIKRPIIGGHSMGATFCLEAVITKRLNVSGLIIADSGSRSAHRTGELISSLKTTDNRDEVLRKIVRTFFYHITEEELVSFVSDALKATDGSLIGSLEGISNFYYDPYIGSIPVPALVFYGEHDNNRSFNEVKSLHERIPSSELVVISDAGHCPMYEQPVVFTQALEKWLARKIP